MGNLKLYQCVGKDIQVQILHGWSSTGISKAVYTTIADFQGTLILVTFWPLLTPIYDLFTYYTYQLKELPKTHILSGIMYMCNEKVRNYGRFNFPYP